MSNLTIRNLTLTYRYVSKMFIQKYLKMGVGEAGGSLRKLCLTTVLSIWNQYNIDVNYNWKIKRKFFKKEKKYFQKGKLQ